MKCAVYLCILATLTLAVPSAVCERAEEQQLILRRNRRTVQFLVNHFVHFFGLSGGTGGTKKIEPKQDNVFALPLTNILKASAGKFSGGSAPKHKQSTDREPTLQHDLPQWIDRPNKVANPYSEAFEADSLEPTRVSLLSTTREPEETTTTTTTEAAVTTTPEPAPIAPTDSEEPAEASETPTTIPAEPEEPATTAPVTDDAPQEGTSSTEASSPAIAPEEVNSLSAPSLSSRTDARDEPFRPTPIPLVSYQHYVQPAIWPGGAGFQHATFPMQQYFGNNVFIPAHNPYPLAAPFQATVQTVPTVHGQGYPASQPVYDNRLYYPTGADSQPKSHSRVKLHDNHYDLITYHDDTEPAASTYQLQTFGNYRTRRNY
uniref:DUF4794 domain-containing protein n=1 Tax=Anopheles epiroticus TaxID=199890 RepID=A0A182PR04_9DIPT